MGGFGIVFIVLAWFGAVDAMVALDPSAGAKTLDPTPCSVARAIERGDMKATDPYGDLAKRCLQ